MRSGSTAASLIPPNPASASPTLRIRLNHGIDVDKVPNLLEEEEEGLEPKGAAAGIAKAAEGEPDQDNDPNAEPQRKAA